MKKAIYPYKKHLCFYWHCCALDFTKSTLKSPILNQIYWTKCLYIYMFSSVLNSIM